VERLRADARGLWQLGDSVAVSADSERLASSSSDKTVKVWDAATGSYVQTLEGHGYLVTLGSLFSRWRVSRVGLQRRDG
jgi:WD40 repeat protein